MCLCVHTYIYIERERERQREEMVSRVDAAVHESCKQVYEMWRRHHYPEGPSTQCWRFLVSKKTILLWLLGQETLDIGYLDPLGYTAEQVPFKPTGEL